MIRILDSIPLSIIVLLCLTVGLAPFVPEPHLWQKIKMLMIGTLTKPVDIFDLMLHSSPFVCAILKVIVSGYRADS